MTPQQIASNPFALMTDPEAIFAAMANSDRLLRLKSRVCRPLDRTAPTPAQPESGVADAAIDAEPDAASDSIAD